VTVSISELRVEYAQYPKREEKIPGFHDHGYPGSVLVSREGLAIEAPRYWETKDENRRKVYVKPEQIDGLIAALQQARDLGRQMFNRDAA
jgi:hypothetical protein